MSATLFWLCREKWDEKISCYWLTRTLRPKPRLDNDGCWQQGEYSLGTMGGIILDEADMEAFGFHLEPGQIAKVLVTITEVKGDSHDAR